MNTGKKRAAPMLQHQDGQMEPGQLRGKDRVSNFEYTIAPPPAQAAFIADLLHPGAENGVMLRDLVALTGWPERDVRLQIEAERRRGIPILSNCKTGYYLPANDDERARFVRSMRHRAQEILRAADAVEKSRR